MKLTLATLSMLLFLLTACGSKSGPSLSADFDCSTPTCTAPSNNPFQLPNLNDVLVLVESVASEGLDPPFLDGYGGTEADGEPDRIVFPADCSNSTPALAQGCGFSAEEAQNGIELNGIPLGYAYTVTVRGRDTDNQQIFSGTSDRFQFTETTTTVPLIDITTN